MAGMLNIESSPKRGIATTIDKTMNTRKLAITTKIENIN
jgi:SLT domain-containing protein